MLAILLSIHAYNHATYDKVMRENLCFLALHQQPFTNGLGVLLGDYWLITGSY